jgi:tetratricopeptide (TPR) repeat protein
MAIEEINMLTSLSPDYPYGFKLSGHFHMINREFSEAIKEFKASLEFSPEDIQVYSDLIDCYLQQDEMTEAEMLACESLEYCKTDVHKGTIYFKLGEIYNKREDKEKARSFYEKSIEVKEDYYPSITSLGLLELGDNNKEYGQTLLLKSSILQPKAIWIRKILGESYMETGKLDLALKEFTAIIELYPGEPYACSKITEINRDLKDLRD